MRQKLAQMWIDTEVLQVHRRARHHQAPQGRAAGARGLRRQDGWVESHQQLQELAMEIQGPYSQLAQGSPIGGGRRPLAVHLPPLAGQLDRGRHHRDPEEHHRRARARPPERLSHGLRLQRGAGAAAEHRAQVLRERVPLRVVRRAWPTPEGITAAFWTKLAEQGWLGPHLSRGVTAAWASASWTWSCSWRRWAARWCPARSSPRVLLGGLAILEAGQRGAEEGVAAEDRGRRGQGRAGLDGAERALGAAGVTLTAAARRAASYTLSGTKLFVHDAHTADVLVVAARTAAQAARGRALALPRAQGHARARGQAAAHDGPDAQALRGDAQDVAVGADALLGPRDGGWAPLPACSTAPPSRSAPRCAAAPSGCST